MASTSTTTRVRAMRVRFAGLCTAATVIAAATSHWLTAALFAVSASGWFWTARNAR